MKLVFLDIDGCLNCHEYDAEVGCGQIHEDKMNRLNVILKKTNAQVVVTSAWRYLVIRGEMNVIGLDWLLRSHGMLKGRLQGITQPDTMRVTLDYNGDPKTWPMTDERGLQIDAYLKNTPHGNYVVIDDLDLGITACNHPFVQTNGKVGLQDGHVEHAIRLLGGVS